MCVCMSVYVFVYMCVCFMCVYVCIRVCVCVFCLRETQTARYNIKVISSYFILVKKSKSGKLVQVFGAVTKNKNYAHVQIHYLSNHLSHSEADFGELLCKY